MVPTGMVRGQANPLHVKLPLRLRKARQAAGLSGSALSAAAGLDRGMVSYLERGAGCPLVSSVEALADVLRVSPGWLAYGVEGLWEPAATPRCGGLAGRLRQLRLELGLSLAEVGRRIVSSAAEVGREIKSSAAAVRSLEGKNLPTIAKLEDVAEALGVSPAWLAYGVGSRDPVRRGARRQAAAAAPAP